MRRILLSLAIVTGLVVAWFALTALLHPADRCYLKQAEWLTNRDTTLNGWRLDSALSFAAYERCVLRLGWWTDPQ